MRAKRPFVALGFASVHDSLAAESLLTRAGVPSLAIPAPRELGSLCGIALRILPEDRIAALEALGSAGALPLAEAEITDF